MTKSEAMKIICVLFGSFPNARFNEQNYEAFSEAIQDLDVKACGAAVQRLIRTNKFLPAIAEIREAATAIVHGPRKTGAQAYGELLAAVQRHGQYPEVRWVEGKMRVQSPWPPLGPDLANAMRQTWGSWSTCCSETGPDAPDRARFIAAYDGLAERERQDLAAGKPLPAPASSRPAFWVDPPRPRPEPEPKPALHLVTAFMARKAPTNAEQQTEIVPRRWSAEELEAALAGGTK